MAKSNRFEKFVNIKNKKASFEFEFIDTYVTGVMLTGTEIKSIRESKVSLTEAFCIFLDGELYIRQMHIAPYSMAASYNHVSVRDRKLLLKKKKNWKSSKLSLPKRALQSFLFVYLSMTVAWQNWKLRWPGERKHTINVRI